jgi:hypothetical protein
MAVTQFQIKPLGIIIFVNPDTEVRKDAIEPLHSSIQTLSS